MARPGHPADWHPLIWVTLAALLAAWQCIGWQYGADDVAFVRWYTELDGGDVAVRWGAVLDDFTGAWGGNRNHQFYRPIVSLSLALDLQLFGANAGVHAAINLLIHIASAWLLYAVGLRVLPGKRGPLIAAALFALTPLAHENIAWAVGRCGLTVLFGLGSGLALLRGLDRGHRGWRLHALPVALVVANLGTMESALGWTLFPPLCAWLATQRRDRPHIYRVLQPYLLCAFGYAGLRASLFGGVTGGRTAVLLPESIGAALLAPLQALYESLSPRDVTWLPEGPATSVYRALCIFPPLVGLAAPFHFKDPRSRAYRRALVALLLFWLVARLPALTILQMGPDLEGSRTAYYAYAPLALVIGLLAATVRYARWACFLLAFLFALNLNHRVAERVAWASLGERARASVYDEARELGATETAGDATIALLNRIDGTGGAPVYHAGEVLYVLYPPFVPERVRAVSVHVFAKIGELAAGAWIAAGLGHLVAVPEPASPRDAVRVERMDPAQFFEELPEGGLAPRLVERSMPYPDLVLPDAWRADSVQRGATPVVLLAAGAENLAVPLGPGGGWPEAARDALALWHRLGGKGAPFACYVETRTDPADPSTARARSRVLSGRIR